MSEKNICLACHKDWSKFYKKHDCVQGKIQKLESELKTAKEIISKMEECVSFYGNKDSWQLHNEAGPYISKEDHEKHNFEDDPDEEYLWITIGGKKARSILLEVEQMKKEMGG